jgi:hypothetical protein
VKTRQRPATSISRWILCLLAASFLIQVGWKAQVRPGNPLAEDLPVAPRLEAMHVAALGEPATFARLAMLYLQSFDYNGSNALPYRKLDYGRLIGWLTTIQALDPLSNYPLFAAARVYAEVPDPVRQRMMLEYIYAEFQLDPKRRWPAAAHAALVAKHRLKDLPLALKYARGIEQLATANDVPLWAKQMEIFILEDMNEVEAARIMLGGLLATGRITDPAEKQFLEHRLKMMDQRSAPKSH